MLFNMNDSHSVNLKCPIFQNQLFLPGWLYYSRWLDCKPLQRLFLVEECKDAPHGIRPELQIQSQLKAPGHSHSHSTAGQIPARLHGHSDTNPSAHLGLSSTARKRHRTSIRCELNTEFLIKPESKSAASPTACALQSLSCYSTGFGKSEAPQISGI